jgi:hypothetical protein
MVNAYSEPYLGRDILGPFQRQQGELFASLFTSTLVPVFNLFQITKIELFESSVELNITKTVEVRWDEDNKKHKLASSSASLTQSAHADTRELLDTGSQ